MKLLLTSGGITNDTLVLELEGLAGKLFSELKIGFIPTAAFADPSEDKSWLINDLYRLTSRGATVAIISLADLTPEEIASRLEPVDIIFIGGGIVPYLSWIMQQKGLFELLPKLLERKVYAGISAGSMVATTSVATYSAAIKSGKLDDTIGPEGKSSIKTLDLAPFMIRPHLNKHLIDEIRGGALDKIANETGKTIYALDDNCAVRMIDGDATVVGEGEWRIITPGVAR